jgi:hypothetical protein
MDTRQRQCGQQRAGAQQQIAPFQSFAILRDAVLGLSTHLVLTHGALLFLVMHLKPTLLRHIIHRLGDRGMPGQPGALVDTQAETGRASHAVASGPRRSRRLLFSASSQKAQKTQSPRKEGQCSRKWCRARVRRAVAGTAGRCGCCSARHRLAID